MLELLEIVVLLLLTLTLLAWVLVLLVLLLVLIWLVLVMVLVLELALVFWLLDELAPLALLEALSVVLAFVSAVFFLVDPRRLYVEVGCGKEAEETSGGVLSVASSAFFLPLPPTGTFPNSLVLPAGPPLVVALDVFVDEDPGGPVLRALVAVSLRRMAPPVDLELFWVFVVVVVLLSLLLPLLVFLAVLDVEGAL